jgi:hypothetical protein
MRKLAGLFGLLILTGTVSSASAVPSDTLDSYREAVRLSKAKDWAGVTAALEKENAVSALKFAEKTRGNAYSALRQLCRDGIAAAPALGSEKGKRLLDSLRVLANHVAKADPRDNLSLLVGIALRAIVERGTVEFYEKTGQRGESERSRVRQAEYKAWSDRVLKEIRALLNYSMSAEVLRRYNLTVKEVQDAQSSELPGATSVKIPPAKQKKLDAWEHDKEKQMRERRFVTKLLREMPN